jgi:hypothetical protein
VLRSRVPVEADEYENQPIGPTELLNATGNTSWTDSTPGKLRYRTCTAGGQVSGYGVNRDPMKRLWTDERNSLC